MLSCKSLIIRICGLIWIIMKISQVKHILYSLGINPRHDLGQNFLLDERVIQKMIQLAGLDGSQHVLEVGPGLGVLTQALLRNSQKVIAVEYDQVLANYLNQKFKHQKFRVVQADIVKILKQSTAFKRQLNLPNNYVLIANLPYQITNHFFRCIFSQTVLAQKIVVMVQKEVALRITQKPGKMSKLSFFVQWYADAKIGMQVSPRVFWPRPKVDSAVLDLSVYNSSRKKWQVTKQQEKNIFELVRRGFEHKRKFLCSNLAKTPKQKKDVQVALAAIGKNAKIRSQELSVQEWIYLAKYLEKNLSLMN